MFEMCAKTKFVLIWIFCITLNDSIFSYALKDVQVTVSSAVMLDENVILTCDYNLEGEPLYSVRWYRGSREFFRFDPSQLPNIKVFPLSGINVDTSKSNATTLVLTSLGFSASGRFSCEVITGAPYFHTVIGSAMVTGFEMPRQGPIINFDDRTYRVGDILEATCLFITNIRPPQVNLTWMINNQEWPINNQTLNEREINSLNSDYKIFDKNGIKLRLNLVLQPEHFHEILALGCRAKILDIYDEKDVRVIHLDYTNNEILDLPATAGSYQIIPSYLLLLSSLICWNVYDIFGNNLLPIVTF